MTQAFVGGVSVRAPGLSGWLAARAVLADGAPYAAAPIELPPPATLAPNERRRATPATRLALALATEAVEMAGVDAGTLRAVFASSNGDGATVVAILAALTGGDGQVSPTQFHNSVHNAPAGYWAIGARSAQAATCLGCHDWTAAGGLLKAVAEVSATRQPVLLCLYDLPLPTPLDRFRDMTEPFGAALVLTPEPTPGSLARLALAYADAEAAPEADPLGLGGRNPLARILPLLGSLARGQPARHALSLLDGSIEIVVTPVTARACSIASASSP